MTSLVKTAVPDGAQPIDADRATITYAMLLNQQRLVVEMAVPQSDTAKLVLNPQMKCKLAVLVVMSTKVWLRTKDIDPLLRSLGYTRRRSTIRRAMKRIVKFGFAVEEPTYDRYRRKKWKLTQRGLNFINSPEALQMAVA